MSRKVTKKKIKKLEKTPVIRRRLLRLWSKQCLEAHNYTCMVCGARKKQEGEIADGEHIVDKVDAHHIVGKEIHDSFFRYHLWNAACLCPRCHKFGNNSAHRNAVFFINFVQIHYPERFKYLLENNEERIDLDNRDVLYVIEEMLKENKPLDLKAIREVERLHPRAIKKKKEEIQGSLFDDFDPLEPSIESDPIESDNSGAGGEDSSGDI